MSSTILSKNHIFFSSMIADLAKLRSQMFEFYHLVDCGICCSNTNSRTCGQYENGGTYSSKFF